ncbi:hypothetical protein ABEG10_23285 [Burkholderia cenocepacia]|uniref:hypothetical protein n=1 Tax=Burkholderia cenocepacia TaxID=95486 RepID=UPI00209F114B|nr:hypothetical protein [Burkholderia cenocepacia]MCO8325934.1 hypothetical protein [Burkholderia cenocepacia]MCO8333004.1 hypothetical protein [Burkholderia cenocepacia]MCO8340504.1 hypothetical protein [Burkholderia cenocepacia]MCO8347790.1 hypothetical protein [Burkholderia cenocepacia]MCO8360856.1 hypothetical protein [Burkholderia cenocepacia]
MAGDWIKMRTNLWDDPRVSNLCDLTGCGEAAVIGGLYWLWATADDHSADGEMHGLTLAAIARKTGVPNLGTALRDIGWIEEIEGGIRLIRFNEHNGTSAKKRAQTGKRVATHRSNADVTQGALQNDESGVTGALAREEKRREEPKTEGTKTDVGEPRASAIEKARPSELSAAMRRNSIEAQPGDPRIVAAAEAGVTVETIEAACAEAKASDPIGRIKPGFVLSIAERWTRDAAKPPARASPQPTWSDQNASTIAALTGRSRTHEPDDRTIDV